MLPVFKEYIQFLKDKTNSNDKIMDLYEGYYWIDNQIIKAFDTQGNIHKIIKIIVNDDLSISLNHIKLNLVK